MLTDSELSAKYAVPEQLEFTGWLRENRRLYMLGICKLCGSSRRLRSDQLNHECQCQFVQTRQQTLLARYGKHPDNNRVKAKATCMARYGTENPTQCKEVGSRISETKLQHSSERKQEIQAKKIATNMTKRGVPHHSMCPEIMDKILLSKNVADRARGFRSVAEAEIEEFVCSLQLTAKHHASGGKEIDILIEEKGIGIEHNGEYWHSEARGRDSRYHLRKKLQAAESSIDLITIWAHLWQTRKDQVKGYLRARLGCCHNRTAVRKLEVREISREDAKVFVEAYHIQGAPARIDLALGAFSGDSLLAVAAFAPHHRGTGQITLNRLCTKDDWTVAGFLGKAVRVASGIYKQDIITWVDRCWSEGSAYLTAGFDKDKILPPDYFYVSLSGGRIISKQSFRKVDSRTESQRAADEGLTRVWDCGKIRFVFKSKPC